jgi:hypothetical protein
VELETVPVGRKSEVGWKMRRQTERFDCLFIKRLVPISKQKHLKLLGGVV